jgi:hypothetical protein
LALSAFFREDFSFLDVALRKLHLLLLKMLIAVTTAVTFLVFAVWIVISSALIVSQGAVAATLIGRCLVDELIVPKGLSNLRCLPTLNPVLLHPVSYSLSELSLES